MKPGFVAGAPVVNLLMAAKKKAKKNQTKSKKSSPRKPKPAKKMAKKKLATKRAPKKQLAKKKVAPKKAATAKPAGKKALRTKKTGAPKKRVQEKSRSVKTEPFLTEAPARRLGSQSGDLQGLSNIEGADSESVDELLEEGNSFEADAVQGVEDADNSDEQEVHTHEVPEDDVPGEYLDEE